METETEMRSLKLTIKVKRKNDPINSSASDDNLKNMDGEQNASTCSNHPSQTGGDISYTKIEHSGIVDKENPPADNSHLQLVLYDPSVVGATEVDPDSISCSTISFRRPHPFSNRTPRVLPCIGAFTVQCTNCFKWRLIPTKEKYEEIREKIMEKPFICESAREWRPEISCDDPHDITQDGSRLWAIDKPSIPQPPPGWQRLLRIRAKGSTRFADVYYFAPSGKRLRSMVEIQRHLVEHPNYEEEGVRLSQFSYKIPNPLQENYVRKRPARPATPNGGGGDPGMQVKAMEWIKPDVDAELRTARERLSTPKFEAPPVMNPGIQPSQKRRKTVSKGSGSGCLVVYHNRNGVETHRPLSGCP